MYGKEDKRWKTNYESRFDSAARAVCDRLRNYLFLLPTDMKEQAQEIRFRVNQRSPSVVRAAYIF